MKILVVGCGKYGTAIIEDLVIEGHDVIALDSDPVQIAETDSQYDVLAICGNGTDYYVLKDLGISSVDVCIACTSSDDTNLLTCDLAKGMGVKHTVARIRERDYDSEAALFMQKYFKIDKIVNPDFLTAEEAYRLICETKAKDAMVLGGSSIGIHLANLLALHGIDVKLIERSQATCDYLKSVLPNNKVYIICSNNADNRLLINEGLDVTSAFIAVTGKDEENILTSLLASQHNVKLVVTKINKDTYTDIVMRLDLEHVVSPRIATSKIILEYVRNLVANE